VLVAIGIEDLMLRSRNESVTAKIGLNHAPFGTEAIKTQFIKIIISGEVICACGKP
jgi:hypothetical protein